MYRILLYNYVNKFLFLISFVFLSFLNYNTLHAFTVETADDQVVEFTGTVTDSYGETLPGVSIINKNTQAGAVSDLEGQFTISASIGDVILFKFIGYDDYTLVYANQEDLTIQLKESVDDLDEVVVIGYGKVTKKEVTGAISQIKGEALKKQVTPSVEQAIQGQVSGVNITAAGRPGDDAIIEIRGISSLAASSTPLYVVDGVPQPNIPRISSNEIESIEVLKDAASTAIYGVQGGNGVILITTKTSKGGKAKISFDHTTGVQRIISERTPLLNTPEQLYARNLSVRNGSVLFFLNREQALRNGTFDIRDLILIDDAKQSTYNIGISGGSDGITYNVSGTYHDQDGVIVNSKFRRYNTRATTTYSKGKLWARASVAYTLERRNDPRWNILPQSVIYNPYNSPITLDQDIIGIDSGSNFLTQNFATAIKEKNQLRRDIVNLSASTSFDLAKNLKHKSWLGYWKSTEISNRFVPQFSTINEETGVETTDPLNSFVSASNRLQESYTIDNSLEWKKNLGQHHITLLGNFSFQRTASSFFQASRQGIANNNIQVINGGTIGERAASGEGFRRNQFVRRIGTLARLQYDYKKRYLLSLAVRRDASSVFGANNRWGTFPSASLAWNVADESFWRPLKSTISQFKLRGSIATVGSDRIEPFLFLLPISPSQGAAFGTSETQVSGFTSPRFSNENNKWETTFQQNVGVDLGFFKNKLSIAAEYYIDEKKDLFLPVRLPASGGSLDSFIIQNVGNLENKGVELELKYKNHIGDFNFNLGATYTQNENLVKDLFNTERIVNSTILINNDGSSLVTQLRENTPASAFFLFETDGVINDDAELAEYTSEVNNVIGITNIRKGDLKIVDQNGDGIINDEDRVFKGSGLPDYTLGFNMSCDYKNFDFSMNWYASVGNEVINGPRALAFARNRHRELLFQWSEANPNSNIPAYRGLSNRHFNYSGSTDLWVEDGSFVRLKQIGIGYTLPKDALEALKIKKFRLSLSAQNALTFTSYSGFDPEITNPLGGNDIRNRGVDIGSYPIAAQYLFGVQVEF